MDEHNEGKLWLTANEHIWQLDIDTNNWEVNGLISDFAWVYGDSFPVALERQAGELQRPGYQSGLRGGW